MLIRNLWDRRSRRRALLILLAADLCLLGVGVYLIVSWVQLRDQNALPRLQERRPPPNTRKNQENPTRNTAPSDQTDPALLTRNAARTEVRTPSSDTQAGAATKTGAPDGGPERQDGAPAGGIVDGAIPDRAVLEPDGSPPESQSQTDTAVTTPAQQQNFLSGVRKALRRRRKSVKACYHEALKLRSKELAGAIQFKFTLRKDGTVKTVSGIKNTTGSAVLEKCVVRVLRRVKFPAPPTGVREFLYPISFKAGR